MCYLCSVKQKRQGTKKRKHKGTTVLKNKQHAVNVIQLNQQSIDWELGDYNKLSRLNKNTVYQLYIHYLVTS